MHKFTPEQEEWLQALESGKYKKTVGSLTLENTATKERSHCCLGVACEIFKDRFKLREEAYAEVSGISKIMYNKQYVGYLPIELEQMLKLKSWHGLFDSLVAVNGTFARSLAVLNDQVFKDDTDFKNVAKFIRENAALIFNNTPCA